MTTNGELVPAPLALVTGASSGIGLEVAVRLAELGHDLVVTSEDDDLALAADGLTGQGRAVRAVRADLTSPEGVDALVAEVTGTGRPLDVLVLNAGTGAGGAFLDVPLERHLATIGLDVVAPVRLAHALLPAMVARGVGRVLVTSSVAALMPGPYYATYAASKAFDLSFAQALRYELRDTGVTVTALLPGPTDTEFFERADMQDTRVSHGDKDDPADVARQAVDGLLEGREKVVVRSLKARAQAAAGAVLSDGAAAAMHARFTEPLDEPDEG
ncbi:short-chain dehydrogenase/reductase SDR [Cellulomonas flavigena DSM 20109]|uniref:Short-chain dehydrogenase/reductase SDR n=1 Tax=Cellulomonas flavigena (strain ATCC 482 / DSM 20109 / BCRC 11376 / JCM 18109 / NBRC 3775 / NCIMB 8073 / NRS 134) TaxID=446466 RepID=D5UKY1_CELFN|nr:SDR family NAD(P)-dependent oxidoreductase [Cellulomonas flavigena]ADG75863.1 short-chain dehydrogenase/reductase SDR [Cellulomonas flavigena DSM 20109]